MISAIVFSKTDHDDSKAESAEGQAIGAHLEGSAALGKIFLGSVLGGIGGAILGGIIGSTTVYEFITAENDSNEN